MLFVVIQEPKAKYRHAYCINLNFVEAEKKSDALKQVERIADTAFKAPAAFPVHAGLCLRT